MSKQTEDHVDKSIDHSYKPIPMMIMKDDSEDYFIEMEQIFDVPFNLVVCGPSKISGKTNLIGNLLLSKEFYRGIFQPENIYVICPTFDVDGKWISIARELKIPAGNVYRQYKESDLMKLSMKFKADYAKAVMDGDLPPYVLVVFDDCSHSGDLKSKKKGFISELFCNLRHYNVSGIITGQKYTQLPTEARSNCTGLLIFACGGSCPDLLYNDVGFGMKRDKFIQTYERETLAKHRFMIYNKTNSPETRFLDSNWLPIAMPYRT